MTPEKRIDSQATIEERQGEAMSSGDTPAPLGRQVAEYASLPVSVDGEGRREHPVSYASGSVDIPVGGNERYSERELHGIAVYIESLWADFVNRFPNAEFLRKRYFEQLNLRDLNDPFEQIQTSIRMFFKVLFDIRHLWDPIGLPIEMTDGWRMRTDAWMMAAGLFDLRDSTPTSIELIRRGESIIDFMSECYFGKLWAVLASHGLGRLSHGGDGDMVGGRLKRDAAGTRKLPALDNIFLALHEALPVSHGIGKALRELNVCPPGPRSGFTGFSIGYGEVEKGDNRVPQFDFNKEKGLIWEFNKLFAKHTRELAPSFQKRENDDGELWFPQVAGPLLALLDRLQRYTKETDYNILMTEADFEKLCPVLQDMCGKPFGDKKSELKGLQDQVIFGVKPEKQFSVNIPKLRNLTIEWYKSHGGVPDDTSARRIDQRQPPKPENDGRVGNSQ